MPPDNGAFMVAAYVVTAVIVVGYAVSLALRIREERRRSGC
jgi:hypothetical protein